MTLLLRLDEDLGIGENDISARRFERQSTKL
jgi:hypothetical protein